jgi:hypothetical protein
MANTRSGLVAAKIYEVDASGEAKGGGISVDFMFNPFEYTVSKSNTFEEKPGNGTDVPQVEFKKAGAQALKVQLNFDTYDKGLDVSLVTNQLWKLMESKTREESGQNEKIPPPFVAFHWGVFKFVAVITNMTQKFTLFKKDGTPVRCVCDTTLTQFIDTNDYPAQNPTSGGNGIERVKRVLAGDRLDTIAADVYGDATKWRVIAEYNNIVNPMTLRPGTQLSIPHD